MNKTTSSKSVLRQNSSLPKSWVDFLPPALLSELDQVLLNLAAKGTAYYPEGNIFTAFEICPPESVKVVIVGQDPYHGAGEAHGLAFSVFERKVLPPSLRNIIKELRSDLGIVEGVASGDLSSWARQGVLLLNSVLTVSPGLPGSHYGVGWESWTDGLLGVLSRRCPPPVFILWGGKAGQKRKILDPKALTIQGAHPSPLAANRGGFFGGRYFSKCNTLLAMEGLTPINWGEILIPK